MVSRLFFLRHGKTDLSGRFAGSTDLSLNAVGNAQIRALRPVLTTARFNRVFCSPMARCRETARHLDLEAAAVYSQDLAEIDFGLWEGRSFAEIERSDPERIKDWLADPDGFRFPEGECHAAFVARVERFKTLLQSLQDETVLVITHGGVIRHLICLLLGISTQAALLFTVNEGAIATMESYPEGGVLTGLNKRAEDLWDA